MKKLMFLFITLFLMGSSAFAQIEYGGGITLGSEMGIDDDGSEKMGIGINLRGSYSLLDKLAASAGFTYFFPSTPSGMDWTVWQINADAHYTFVGAGVANIYALGGLNYTHSKVEIDAGLFTGESDDGEVGLDLGIGGKIDIGGFGEIKYDTALEQIAITVGFMF